MKNFIFKSSNPDLQKMFQYIETKLDVQNSNVLYLTHRLDYLIRQFKIYSTDTSLQKQVDDYFEDDSKNIPEDSDHKDGPEDNI